jgi:hypothetical protein
MSEELQKTFQAVIRVNYITNSELEGTLFAKLRGDMKAEHTALLCYCETRYAGPLVPVFHGLCELKEEITIFLRDRNKRKCSNIEILGDDANKSE